jgi:hypothetical protein
MLQPMFSALGLLHGSWHQAPPHWLNAAEASYPHDCVPSSLWWYSHSLRIRRPSPCCCVRYLRKYIHIKITIQDMRNPSIIRTCSEPLLRKLITLSYMFYSSPTRCTIFFISFVTTYLYLLRVLFAPIRSTTAV